MQLNIHRYYLPASLQNFNHLVWSAEAKTAAVVDPFDWPAALDQAQRLGVSITEIWLTHGHGDHTRGVPHDFTGPVRGHPSNANGLVNHPYDHAQQFEFAGARVHVLVTPGHIADHLCFFIPSAPALLAGDTLFNAGVGNTRSGDPLTLFDSIQQLRKLPNETQVFNGHDYFLNNLRFTESVVGSTPETRHWIQMCESSNPDTRPITTLADESSYNLFLQTSDQRLWARLTELGYDVTSPETAFVALRQLRDQW